MLKSSTSSVRSLNTLAWAIIGAEEALQIVTSVSRASVPVAVHVSQAHTLARGVQGRLFPLGSLDERAVRLLEEDLQPALFAVRKDDVVQPISVQIPHRECVLERLRVLLAPDAVALPGAPLPDIEGDPGGVGELRLLRGHVVSVCESRRPIAS